MMGAGGPRGPRPVSHASYWAAIKAAIFLSTYLMREAISDGTQGQSALALRRNQRWHLSGNQGGNQGGNHFSLSICQSFASLPV
jgi:hypothetical protein